jgi:hypothetical protein
MVSIKLAILIEELDDMSLQENNTMPIIIYGIAPINRKRGTK